MKKRCCGISKLLFRIHHPLFPVIYQGRDIPSEMWTTPGTESASGHVKIKTEILIWKIREKSVLKFRIPRRLWKNSEL